jgi:hypothetical protein
MSVLTATSSWSGWPTLCHEDHEHGAQETRTALMHAIVLLGVPCSGCQQVGFFQRGVQPAIRQVLG